MPQAAVAFNNIKAGSAVLRCDFFLPARQWLRICNPESHELRTVETLPDDGRLVRLYIGLEHAPDPCADLAQPFDQMG